MQSPISGNAPGMPNVIDTLHEAQCLISAIHLGLLGMEDNGWHDALYAVIDAASRRVADAQRLIREGGEI